MSWVSNEMLIYSTDTRLPTVLKSIFNKCSEMIVTPLFFNISVLKPIAKGTSVDTTQVNNLRPVAVSDCVFNLLESLLLSKLNDQVIENKIQI